jgi:hypothetical protein
VNAAFPLILFWGLKRSGNHAIINWLLPQARCVFFNNIVPIAPILLGRAELPAPCDYDQWLADRLTRGQKLAGLLRKTTILASIEDHELDLKPFTSLPAGTRNIVLLRDPENFFASRIRKGFKIDHPAYPSTSGSAMQRVVDLWKSYARECLGETAFLENKTVIYFPRWFADQRYRSHLSEALGLRHTDAGFGMVSGHGGGSSFDTMEYAGAGSRMKVLERSSQLDGVERELLELVMHDPQLSEYANRLDEHLATTLP